MKANRLVIFLLLAAAVFQVPAQQTETDRKLFEEIKSASETGDPKAQYELASIYFDGNLGVTEDKRVAADWFQKAAEQGHSQAQFMIAACHSKGVGVPHDMGKTIIWIRKAAEQDHPLAQCALGAFYHDGDGVAKDYSQAVNWWRKAAEGGIADAQFGLGLCYANGEGVTKDAAEAVKWFHKASEQGDAGAQNSLGNSYSQGDGVAQDLVKAVKWYRMSAEQGMAIAQCNLGANYANGIGVTKDKVEAMRWFRKAAEQGYARAQILLGVGYYWGDGSVKDYVEAYKWLNLGLVQGNENPLEIAGEKGKQLTAGIKATFKSLELAMTQEQIAQAQQLSREFKARKAPESGSVFSLAGILDSRPEFSGTGFFISEDGFLISNNHVVAGANQVRLVTSAGLISAKVVKVDAANDLALLKAEGNFPPLPVAASRRVKLGGTVATVGFPNIGLQGFAPKLAKGEIASLSGAGDDARYFQISVPVQPGNSGGALVDERGNVVGVVSAKLNASAALRSSGSLPENVNYAVKSSYLLSFLESVPDVASKLKEPSTKEKKFEEVVKEAEQAAVLVLVY